MFEAALTEDRRRALDGFVHFPEASTPYGRTEMALASMFAPRSYAYEQPLSDYVERAFVDERGLLGLLRADGYHTTGWLHGVDFFGGSSPFDQTYLHREVAGAVSVAGERSTLVRSIWLHTHLPRRVATPLMPDRHLRQLAGNALLPDEAPPQSVGSFWELIDAETRRSGHGRYVLAHFILPHFPYVLNDDCEVVAAGTTPRGQASCALRLVEVFVGLLQELGRYDDSLIIVQSDHGARYELRDGELVDVEDQGSYSDEWSLHGPVRSCW